MNVEEIKAVLKEQREEEIELTSNERIIPRGLIVPTIGSGLHLSFGGQSSGSEVHSHLEIGDPSFTLSGSREIENGDDSCSSLSLIKLSIELERRIINATKKNSTKEVFKLYKGAIHPRLRAVDPKSPP
ncbi:MAG: hypothetical protein QXY87_13710 [Saccharolobus sp.]|uniref:hypothetical protein n=1 Tax=Saccharolobus TaxID=2100760 RepID=UPI0030B8E5D6